VNFAAYYDKEITIIVTSTGVCPSMNRLVAKQVFDPKYQYFHYEGKYFEE
jgi:hypothetical protein